MDSNSIINVDDNASVLTTQDYNNHNFECCICKQSVGLPEWFITCATCGITVHYTCYFLADNVDRSVPWKCKPCRLDEDPNTLICDLCSNKGGAYLHTEKFTWVHTLCSNWIPEIVRYRNDINEIDTFISLEKLDKARFKLKCSLCNRKGASIRCAFPRCDVNAHPWCMLNDVKGSKSRICKDDDNNVHYEMFCKFHADNASLPYSKPKQKVIDNDTDDVPIMKITDTIKESEKKLHPYFSMAHMLDYETANCDKFSDTKLFKNTRKSSSASLVRSVSSSSFNDSPREV